MIYSKSSMKKKKKNFRKNENNHFQILKMNGASNASPSIINSSSDGGHSSFERQQSSLNRSFGAVVALGNHVQNKFQNSLNYKNKDGRLSIISFDKNKEG